MNSLYSRESTRAQVPSSEHKRVIQVPARVRGLLRYCRKKISGSSGIYDLRTAHDYCANMRGAVTVGMSHMFHQRTTTALFPGTVVRFRKSSSRDMINEAISHAIATSLFGYSRPFTMPNALLITSLYLCNQSICHISLFITTATATAATRNTHSLPHALPQNLCFIPLNPFF